MEGDGGAPAHPSHPHNSQKVTRRASCARANTHTLEERYLRDGRWWAPRGPCIGRIQRWMDGRKKRCQCERGNPHAAASNKTAQPRTHTHTAHVSRPSHRVGCSQRPDERCRILLCPGPLAGP
eukprot:3282041-Prymnesium_polylepis.1